MDGILPDDGWVPVTDPNLIKRLEQPEASDDWTPVTDPELIKRLEQPEPADDGWEEVTDPNILKMLETEGPLPIAEPKRPARWSPAVDTHVAEQERKLSKAGLPVTGSEDPAVLDAHMRKPKPVDMGDLGNEFLRSVGQQNFDLYAEALMIQHDLTGDPQAKDFADLLKRTAKSMEGGVAPRKAKENLTDVRSIQEAIDWAQASLGQGVGSTMGPLVGGGMGYFGGKKVGGKVGGKLGAGVGALFGSAPLSLGEMRKALIEEGVEDPKLRAEWAIKGGMAMAALDSALPASLASKIMSGGTRKAIQRGIIQRIMQGGAKGFAVEGATEGTQASIEYLVKKHASGNPVSAEEWAHAAFNEGAAGAVGGAGMGGVTGAIPDQPIPDQTVPTPPPQPPPGTVPGELIATPQPTSELKADRLTLEQQVSILQQQGFEDEQIVEMDDAEREAAAVEGQQAGIEPIEGLSSGDSETALETPEAPVPITPPLPEETPQVPLPESAPIEVQEERGTRNKPQTIEAAQDLDEVRRRVDTEPTEAQKAANNYTHGHAKLHGFDISIENPKGSIRRGKNADGTDYEATMPGDYGYLKRSRGRDDDHVDAYIGNNPESTRIFVIDQTNPNGKKIDEHKVIFAVNDEADAVHLYHQSFSDGEGINRIGSITETTPEQLRDWLAKGSVKHRFSKQKRFHVKSSQNKSDLTTDAEGQPLPPQVGEVKASKKARAPQSFINWIIAQGGIRDDTGELKAMDAHKRWGLVRKDGKSADEIRELAVGAGYLVDSGRDFGGEAQTTKQDVYDAIAEERSGIKRYPVRDRQEAIASEIKAQAALAPEAPPEFDEWGPTLYGYFQRNGVEPSDFNQDDLKAAKAELELDPLQDVGELLDRIAIASELDDLADASEQQLQELPDPFIEELESDQDADQTAGAVPEAQPEVSGRGEEDQGSVGQESGPQEPEAVQSPGDGEPRPEQAAEAVTTEVTEAGTQTVLPGAEKITKAEEAQRQADKPLKAKAPQKGMDEGLFGDEKDQTDLIDRLRQKDVLTAAPAEKAPVFYSGLIRAVEGMKQPKAPAAQWMNTIRNAPGVKAEELDWLGLPDWLGKQSGPITKDALLDFLKANQISVNEVEKGGPNQIEFKHGTWSRLTMDTLGERTHEATFEGKKYVFTLKDARKQSGMYRLWSDDENIKSWDRAPDNAQVEAEIAKYLDSENSLKYSGTQFEKYTLPGGENYRELLLTLPDRREAGPKTFAQWADESGREDNADSRHAYQQWMAANPNVSTSSDNFTASHWREPNVLLHVRFNERTTSADGTSYTPPQKTLFIEEIQSDWHQKGRRQGYQEKLPDGFDDKIRDAREELEEQLSKDDYLGFDDVHLARAAVMQHPTDYAQRWEMSEATKAAAETYLPLVEQKKRSKSPIPDAPFKTTWPELALKRVIRWAAENNFERIAWTPGEVQAERYDLSKRISKIEYRHEADGRIWINAKALHDERSILERTVDPEELDDIIGKDVADKIRSDQGKPYPTSFDGLKKRGVPTEIFQGSRGEWRIRFASGEDMGSWPSRDAAERDAERMKADLAGGDYKELTGLDLKVGGEGMKAFYDKMLVDVANKLGKKFGAKVGRTKIVAPRGEERWAVFDPESGEPVRTFASEEAAQDYADAHDLDAGPHNYEPTLVPSLDIPPAMREAAMAGQPLFRREEPKTGNLYQFVITDKQREHLKSRVNVIAKRIMGRTLPTIEFHDTLPGGFEGAFLADEWLIYLALQARTDPRLVLRHEAVHVLKNVGLFTSGEWATLSRLAQRKWIDQFQIRKRYEHYDKGRPNFDELMIEEAIADAYLHYAAHGPQKNAADRIFEKLKRLLEAIRNMLRGEGFTSVNDIFDKIERGQVASRKITQTSAFKKWFGGSTIVDPQGNPLVVYHGTPVGEIDAFKTEHQGKYMGLRGAYFATNPKYASVYAMGKDGPAPTVYPVFLKVEKPLVIKDLNFWEKTRGKLGGFKKQFEVERRLYYSAAFSEAEVQKLKAQGYDGVVNEARDEIIVFEPTQIKSATGNRGTFNAADPNILTAAQPPDGNWPTGHATDPTVGPDPKDFQSNINLDKIDSTDAVKDILRTTGEQSKHFFAEARRGVVSHQKTIELARLMGMTQEDLLNRRRGQAFNAHEAFAASVILTQSADNLAQLAEVNKQQKTTQSRVQLQKAWARHVAIQEQVAGITAEAGRALNQFKMMRGPNYLPIAKAMAEKAHIINRENEIGKRRRYGEDAIDELGDLIIKTKGDRTAINKFTRDTYKITAMDMIREYWINSVLTGLQTSGANITGNLASTIAQIPETFLAGLIGKLHGGEKVYMRETTARLTGLIGGTVEGMSQGWEVLITGEDPDPMTKLDVHKKAIPGLAGEIIRAPTERGLAAQDKVFKVMNYRAEINALAARIALSEGKSGQDLQDRITQLRSNPTPRMHQQAHAYAEYQTFQTRLKELGTRVTQIRDSIPFGYTILAFVKTSSNLLKYAFERSPAAFLMGEARNNLLGKNGAVARDTQWARLSLGTGMALWGLSMVAAGMMTGSGPDDPNERKWWLKDHEPYSIKVGDRWYSYRRIEPMGTILGITADLVGLEHMLRESDLNKAGGMLVTAIAQNVMSKSWLTGPSKFLEAWSEGGSKWDRYIADWAGSFIPNISAQYTRVNDPVFRDVRGFVDNLKSRIPFLADDLPPKLDFFGDPIRRPGQLGPDIVSPIAAKQDTDDPLYDAVINSGYFPGMPSRKLNKHELTPQQYHEYAETAGKKARAMLQDQVKGKRWARLSPDEQADIIRDKFTKARKFAGTQMKKKYPVLRKPPE